MPDRYDYTKGQCTICRAETDVRWKNIYLIGSEGISICIDCEKKLLGFLENLSRKFALARKEKFKEKRRREQDESGLRDWMPMIIGATVIIADISLGYLGMTAAWWWPWPF